MSKIKNEIRYTKGPAELMLGDVYLQLGEWVPVDDVIAAEAAKKGRHDEYGFEVKDNDQGGGE